MDAAATTSSKSWQLYRCKICGTVTHAVELLPMQDTDDPVAFIRAARARFEQATTGSLERTLALVLAF
jgi:hypothetical protein